MARPNRNDVDYFPLYCKEGKTMHFIRNKFGNDGYVVWIRTLRALAVKNYHYLDFNDETELLFHASDCNVEPDVVLGVLNCLAKFGEIDSEFWECNVVWSEKFIDSIKDAYRKRAVKIQLRADILRLSSALNHISSAENEVSSAINPQRKEKKSKEDYNENKFSEKIIELGKYVFKDTFSVDRAITTYSTSLNNLKESFLNFLMSEKYHEKELNDLAMDKMSKHFFRWLLTHQPKKVEHSHADLLQGEWGVDFHLKPTPNDKEAIQELLNDGWVRTNEGMAKRIKK